jgi:hypothetical protein
MQAYLFAAVLLCAFAAPAAAADPYYVMFNNNTKKCSIARTAATPGERLSMLGIYGSEKAAKIAMGGMMRCRRV